MDGTRALRIAEAGPRRHICDRCGKPAGDLPPVQIGLFHGALLSRCDPCGLRTLERHGLHTAVSTCRRCGLAYTVDDDGTAGRCEDCRARRLPEDLPRGAVARAAEHALRAALSDSLRFVALPSRSDYLTGVARAVATGIPGAASSESGQDPGRVVVSVFRDDAEITLALPSGTLLLSTGCLAILEDEAELAFLLGHELAHVAAGDAAIGLIRVGLVSLATAGESQAWTRAATDIVRLGYGSEPERAADLAALRALVRLGYDPTAPLHYLERLQARLEAGDPNVAALACAHPPAEERRGRLEDQRLRQFPAEGPGRTNRELFRRAAGHSVLSSKLVPLPNGIAEADPTGGAESTGPFRIPWPVLLTTLGISLLASLFLILGFLLAR